MRSRLLKIRKLFFVTQGIILLLIACAPGCGGGGLSQDDLMQRAARRKRKKSDSPPVVQTTTPAKPADLIKPTRKSSKSPSEEPPINLVAKEKEKSSNEKAIRKLATAPQQPLSDTKQKPAQLPNFATRCRSTADNLDRIAKAMEAYLQDKGTYPPRAIYGDGGAPLLSWRVELLPYLGYESLYDQFELDKPWNSPTNKALLDKIPAVYQSPERFDNRTNYLVAAGSSTIFPGPRAPSLRRIEDGVEHTLLLVEVNENLSVAWTKPKEYKYEAKDPKRGLGELRQGSVYVVWGGGITGALPLSTSPKNFNAMFTIDGGEPFSSYSVSVALDDDYFSKHIAQGPVSTTNLLKASSAANTSKGFSGTKSNFQRSAAQTNSLASEYLEAARTAYALHTPADALLWYYAANLLQPMESLSAQHYHWVPALKRPSSTIHFCIGIQSKSYLQRKISNTKTRGTTKPHREETLQGIPRIGQQLIRIIEQHAANLVPPALSGKITADIKNTRGLSQRDELAAKALPITYLGRGSRSDLTQRAVAGAGDVLVLFEMGTMSSNKERWLSCSLIDLARRKSIFSLPRIQMPRNSEDPNFQTENKAFKQKRWQLQDVLEDSFIFQKWPDNLKPRHAKMRIHSLAEIKTLNTLAALTEMMVYRDHNLIDNQQLLDGFRGVLGEKQGEHLMLGDNKSRVRLLRNWLPEKNPHQTRQLAQQLRAREDKE